MRQKISQSEATGNGEVHIFPVTCEVRTVGCYIVVTHSHPRRLFAGMPIMVWKITEPRNDGIQHRDIDKLTATGFFPLVKREENAQGRVHPGGNIGDGETGPSRLVGIAGGGDDSPFSLNEEIIGLDVAVRSVLAIAGERTIDEPWIDLAKRFVAKAETSRNARGIILKEDVGSSSPILAVWLFPFPS